ncbi:MAG TPA: plastocyanin/azurin family copper-binding protein [Frankiaceae bacterium]|nr:plastocyanin/azurin family copper-binding protein [Frankiaceae bacterium]
MLAHRPLRLATVLVVAALALTACGEPRQRTLPSDKATPVAVGSVPATVYPSPTKAVPSPTAASPTGSASASASPTGGGGGGNEVLATATNKFDPVSLKVKKGTKVTWTAEGFHTVTSGTAKDGPDAAGPMKSPSGFKTYSVTFAKAGTFKYYCQPHATLGMEGEVVVS